MGEMKERNEVVNDAVKLYLKEPLPELINQRKTIVSAMKYEHDTYWRNFYQSLVVLINRVIKLKEESAQVK